MPEVRLIDADAFSEQYGDYYAEQGPAEGFIGTVGELIAKQQTIEAEPVRHGRWIFAGEETLLDGWTYRKHRCTECDFVTVEAKNYCQNCGARMDGGAENG